MSTESHEVVDVVVERQVGLTIEWSDGLRGSIGLTDLRNACPCAACRGRRDQGLEVWPAGRTGTAATLQIVDAELVGAWGLSVRWQDGHDTGIYPWDSLRRWLDDDAPSPPDDRLGTRHELAAPRPAPLLPAPRS